MLRWRFSAVCIALMGYLSTCSASEAIAASEKSNFGARINVLDAAEAYCFFELCCCSDRNERENYGRGYADSLVNTPWGKPRGFTPCIKKHDPAYIFLTMLETGKLPSEISRADLSLLVQQLREFESTYPDVSHYGRAADAFNVILAKKQWVNISCFRVSRL